MKTRVDIITGFLGSGKTTFINGLLQSDRLGKERIVVIQCEIGEEEIEEKLIDNRNVHVEKINKEKPVDAIYVKNIIKKYLPDRIIIEHSGMLMVEELLNELEKFKLRRICKIDMIFHLLDPATFDVFMNNMGSILTNQIVNSDLIIINSIERLSRYKLNKMHKALTDLNKSVRVLSISSREEYKQAVDCGDIYNENEKLFSRPSDKLFFVLILLIASYFVITLYKVIRSSNIDSTGLQVFNC